MNISVELRREPLQGKKGFSAHKGFTVIELMVVVAVIAIIASVALPSYQTIIEKRQVTSGANQVSAFLSSASMEAVKRNREVAIRCDADGCATIVLDDSGADDETLRNIDFSDFKADVDSIAAEGDDGQIVFDPIRGMLIQDDIAALPLDIGLSSSQDFYALNVRVMATGRISICSNPAAEYAVPGYAECQVIP